MNLKEFKFPEVSKIDLAFPTFDTIPVLLKEAKARGFLDGETEYNKMFKTLFYTGGTPIPKEGVDEDFACSAFLYAKALMGSYTPKHEHKEAVCVLIFSEVLESVQPLSCAEETR